MAKLIIDGQEIDAPDGITLLQACEMSGAEIPRFCFHERLSIAGNCRMCLVEWVGAPKPQASCALSVNDLRPNPDGTPPQIRTDSPLVKAAREGVMEFLLINHPLDCPICDQGGECDLQDQAMAYGVDTSRYAENKRAVEEKYLGPLVKTTMTRCIHCTRCVRFASEVAGVEDLGAIGRGEDMEITTYLERAMTSELSGNVIDLCPVGALTSKPFAFTSRSWELRKTETIDVMDALGCNIRVDSRGRDIMRIMPRIHDDVNEEWISDKARFIWDGLKVQRLDQPYVRRGGRLEAASWDEAFASIAAAVKSVGPARMAALCGDLAGGEEIFALKDLMQRLGVNNMDCREPGLALDDRAGRAGYLFNSTIAGIEDADAILLVGANPRLEAAVLNARIRKTWLAKQLPVGLVGEPADLTYDVRHLGAGPQTLKELAAGSHKFSSVLARAERAMIIVGSGALTRKDAGAVLALAARIAVDCGALAKGADWNGFNVLHRAASRVGALDIGFLPHKGGCDTAGILEGARSGDIGFVYLLGADEIDTRLLDGAFVVYQGSHGDRGAHAADVILPGACFTEKSGTYVNMEGRVQLARRAVFPPGDAREDWAILRALSQHLGCTLPYNTLEELRGALYGAHPHLARIDVIEPGDPAGLVKLANGSGKPGAAPFAPPVEDFFLTNPIARASRIMAELSKLHRGEAKGTGTDG